MFSKFKVDKPQANVLYKRGPRHFEVEQSVLSLPLLEAYDQRIRHLHEIVSDQATELAERRAEVFQLRQELQRLRNELAQSRHPVKNAVKFNVSRENYWDVDKSSRSMKRKKNQRVPPKCHRYFTSGIQTD